MSRDDRFPFKDYKTDLFKGVVYHVSNTFKPVVHSNLCLFLNKAGAVPCPTKNDGNAMDRLPLREMDMNKLTHIITDSTDFAEYAEITRGGRIAVVSPLWVVRTWDIQAKQDPSYYSADVGRIFSGVCICCAQLPGHDEEHLAAIVLSAGGQFKTTVTKEVTHLIAINEFGQKYAQVLRNGLELGMKIVLPQWIFDSLTASQRLPCDPYAFPNPPLLNVQADGNQGEKPKMLDPPPSMNAESYALGEWPANNSASYYKFACQDPQEKDRHVQSLTHDVQFLNGAQEPIFKGLRVFIDQKVEMSSNVAAAIHKKLLLAKAEDVYIQKSPSTNIQDTGQTIFEQEEALMAADIVICPKRSGWVFWKAYQKDKVIGNFSWLIYVLTEGKLDSPLQFMLHYPLPHFPVRGFDTFDITITNYTGQARDLLKRIIEAMGGRVRGDMNKSTTHVIAASKTGKKVESAIDWHKPVINHTWINECFARWTVVEPANLRSAHVFEPAMNYAKMLGNQKLRAKGIAEYVKRAEAQKDEEYSLEAFEAVKQQDSHLLALDPSSSDAAEGMQVDDRSENEDCDVVDDEDRQPSPSGQRSATPEERIADKLIPRSAEKLKASKSSPAVVYQDRSSKALSNTESGKQSNRAASHEPTSTPRKSPPGSHRAEEPSSSAAPPSSIPKARSRRTAAATARSKVEAAAKDMLEHEKEKKRKRPSDIPGTEETPRKSILKSAADFSDGVSAKSKRKPKGSSHTAPEADTDDEDPASTAQSSQARKKQKKTKESARRTCVVMTTGYFLDEKLTEKAEDLGMEFTKDPGQCTHVVAKGISRTEKFLCALPHLPYFVSTQWLEKSLDKGDLLDVDRYPLADPINEAKWKFKFKDALQRAAQRKVFHGRIFSLTSDLGYDEGVIQRIIESNGGTVIKDLPSATQLIEQAEKYFIVSCGKDRKRWKKLTDDHDEIDVYSAELILLSAITQRFSNKNPAAHLIS